MPTYDYRCPTCGATDARVQSIRAYCECPEVPLCGLHGAMQRHLTVVPAMSGLANALAGDRHYDGLRAPDGTDISSRTKHREYMKSRGLTTTDDFTNTWSAAEKERAAMRSGEHKDPELRSTIEQQVMTAVAKPD